MEHCGIEKEPEIIFLGGYFTLCNIGVIADELKSIKGYSDGKYYLGNIEFKSGEVFDVFKKENSIFKIRTKIRRVLRKQRI